MKRPSPACPANRCRMKSRGSTSSTHPARPAGRRASSARTQFPPFGTGIGLELLLKGAFGFGPDSVYLCPAPLYHAAPIGWSFGAHRNGSTVVLMERFDPVGCLRAIESYGVTHAQFVPTHFVRMLKLPVTERRAFDVSTPADGHPCRGAMPGRRQAADDRLVRPEALRVLRGQRRQRDDDDRLGGLARPSRLGRAGRRRHRAHLSERTAASCRPGRTGSSTSRARPSSTTTTPPRPPARATRRAGPLWATWGTSTPTASCTCPTGAPTSSSRAASTSIPPRSRKH